MTTRAKNKPSHITKGDVLDDLGFSRSETTALKIKADLLDSILLEIQRRNYTQRDLVDILDEYQPSVSNLLQGKIAKVSIEKLLHYSDRLNMRALLTVMPVGTRRGTVGQAVQPKRQPQGYQVAAQRQATLAKPR